MRSRVTRVEVIMSPRLMNYVLIPYNWTIHLSRGSSTRATLHSRNWIGGRRKGTQEGRQTIFFTPFDPFNIDTNEADPIADLMKPRKKESKSLET